MPCVFRPLLSSNLKSLLMVFIKTAVAISMRTAVCVAECGFVALKL